MRNYSSGCVLLALPSISASADVTTGTLLKYAAHARVTGSSGPENESKYYCSSVAHPQIAAIDCGLVVMIVLLAVSCQ